MRGKGETDAPTRLPARARFDLQAIPVFASIRVGADSPRVQIEFRVVNYTKKRASLRDLRVTRLALGSGAIDDVRLGPSVEVYPGRAVQVFCERPLADSEARQVAASHGRDPWRAA